MIQTMALGADTVCRGTPLVAPLEIPALLRAALVALAPRAAGEKWWHAREALVRELPKASLRALCRTVARRLREPGYVVVRARSVPDDALRLLQLALGESFGTVVTRAPDAPGRPLFRVTAGDAGAGDYYYGGNAKNRRAIGLHTDASGVPFRVDLLSMVCLQPAGCGGETRLADARLARDLLPLSARSVLERDHPREHPYRPMGRGALVAAPVFDRNGAFRYHPARLRNGIAAARGALSAEERAAADALDRALAAIAVEFLLQAGDQVLLDNHRLAHDRRAFEDDPCVPRLIERLWIRSSRKEDEGPYRAARDVPEDDAGAALMPFVLTMPILTTTRARSPEFAR